MVIEAIEMKALRHCNCKKNKTIIKTVSIIILNSTQNLTLRGASGTGFVEIYDHSNVVVKMRRARSGESGIIFMSMFNLLIDRLIHKMFACMYQKLECIGL